MPILPTAQFDPGLLGRADQTDHADGTGVPMARRRWPFVGREEDLAHLASLVTPGSVVFLSGPEGSGVTTLLAEFGRRMGAQGWRVHQLAGGGEGRLLPFGAVSELLPRVAAGVGAPAARTGPEATGAARPPGGPPELLTVDNTELLDEAQAALVQRHAGDPRGALVIALGSDASAELPRAISALLRTPGAQWVSVAPLSDEVLTRLVATVLGAPCDPHSMEALLAVSRRHLLFLREMVLGGCEDGRLRMEKGLCRWHGSFTPAGMLGALIDARLRAVQPHQRDALEALALAEPLELRAAQRLLAADDLADLERRGILRLTHSSRRALLTFAHPLYTERMRTLTQPLRRDLHRRSLASIVADLPERRLGDASRLVSWQLESGIAITPARLLQAARERCRSFEFGQAVRLAEAALRDGAGVEASLLLAQALLSLGRAGEAEAVLSDASRHAERPQEVFELLVQRARTLAFGLGRPRAALNLLDTCAPSGPEQHSELAGVRACIAYADGYPGEACHLLLAARGSALAHEPTLARYAWVPLYARTDLGCAELALEEGRAHQAMVARHADRYHWLVTEWDFGQWRALFRLGRLEEAEALATKHFHGCAQSGQTDYQRVWALARGLAALRRGLPRTALSWLGQARDDERPLPGQLWRLCQRAIEEARACLGAEEEPDPARGAQAADDPLAQAWRAVGAGTLPLALENLDVFAHTAATQGRRSDELEALDHQLRLGGGRPVAQRLAALATGVDGELAHALGERARALLAGDAEGMARTASVFSDLGMLLAAAETACLAAELFRRDLRPAAAHRETARASAWAAHCEGARTPLLATLKAADAGLTRREREIAELAAAGLSSPAIAARLTISVRTVESHLYSCYTKLGLRSRAELVETFAPRVGIPAP